MGPIPEYLMSARARDAALRRLRRIELSVALLGLALAAGFAVLAHAATTPHQKQRATLVAEAPVRTRGTRVHHRHHRSRPRHHAATAKAATAPATPAPATPAPSPAVPPAVAQPPAPAPRPAPAQVQPPPAPPVQTYQPPVATSGGS
jgi:hypothetical protein